MSEVKPQTPTHLPTLRHHHATRPVGHGVDKAVVGKWEFWSESGVLTLVLSDIVADAGGSGFHRAAGLLYKAG